MSWQILHWCTFIVWYNAVKCQWRALKDGNCNYTDTEASEGGELLDKLKSILNLQVFHVHTSLKSISHSQVFFQFVHDSRHFVCGDHHHCPERLHGDVVIRPPATQTGICIFLDWEVELQGGLLKQNKTLIFIYMSKCLNIQLPWTDRLYLVKEFLLCIDEHVLLFRRSSSGRDILGRLFARLADHQAVVTLPTGLIRPLSFRYFFPKGQWNIFFNIVLKTKQAFRCFILREELFRHLSQLLCD